ncbi:hypothetical protein LguiA_017619 [Lonicera macranthoides]
MLFSQQDESNGRARVRMRDEEGDFDLLPQGKTGEDSVTGIPFQELRFRWFSCAFV